MLPKLVNALDFPHRLISLRVLAACCCRYTCQPPGVPAPGHLLSLPGEVWLSILSLLPLSDLCTVHSTDHTLCESALQTPSLHSVVTSRADAHKNGPSKLIESLLHLCIFAVVHV